MEKADYLLSDTEESKPGSWWCINRAYYSMIGTDWYKYMLWTDVYKDHKWVRKLVLMIISQKVLWRLQKYLAWAKTLVFLVRFKRQKKKMSILLSEETERHCNKSCAWGYLQVTPRLTKFSDDFFNWCRRMSSVSERHWAMMRCRLWRWLTLLKSNNKDVKSQSTVS